MGDIANQIEEILDWARTRKDEIVADIKNQFDSEFSVDPFELKDTVEETIEDVCLQKEEILGKCSGRMQALINNARTCAVAFDLGEAEEEVYDIIAEAIDEIEEAQSEGVEKVVESMTYGDDTWGTTSVEFEMDSELDDIINEGNARLDELESDNHSFDSEYDDDWEDVGATSLIENARDELDQIHEETEIELDTIKEKYENCKDFLDESERKIDLIAGEGKGVLETLKEDTIKQLECIQEEREKHKEAERQNTGNVQKLMEVEQNAATSNNSDNKGFETATQMSTSAKNPVQELVPVSDNKEKSEIGHNEKSPEGRVPLSQEPLLVKNEPSTEKDVSTPISSIGSDLKQMYYSEDNLADIELEMKDGLKLHSHAFVLSARSPVLRTIIQKEMKRNDYQGKIKLENINGNIMKSILHWIYAAEFKNDLQSLQWISEVVEAAVALELKDFLKLLEDKIIGLCDKENMIELYQVVDKYQLLKAKEHIRNFIKMSIP